MAISESQRAQEASRHWHRNRFGEVDQTKANRDFERLRKMGLVVESDGTPDPGPTRIVYRGIAGSSVEITVRPNIVHHTDADGQQKRYIVWQPTKRAMRALTKR